jgi:hypothetical protein
MFSKIKTYLAALDENRISEQELSLLLMADAPTEEEKVTFSDDFKFQNDMQNLLELWTPEYVPTFIPLGEDDYDS